MPVGDEVTAIAGRVKMAAARVAKEQQETFWGGFSGYVADLDGHYWEVAWGPMSDFNEHGELRFKLNA